MILFVTTVDTKMNCNKMRRIIQSVYHALMLTRGQLNEDPKFNYNTPYFHFFELLIFKMLYKINYKKYHSIVIFS